MARKSVAARGVPSSSTKPNKPKGTKSRNGCLTCKKKRLKCDESKPACFNCISKKIDCGGYATNFKWMSYETEDGQDSGSSTKAEGRPKGQSMSFQKHLELASISVTGRSLNDIKQESELISQGLNPRSYRKRKSNDEQQAPPLKRSRSLSSGSLASGGHSPGPLAQRSWSTNGCAPTDLQVIRAEYAASGNSLDSLAEAAIDEIASSASLSKTHSPANQVPFSPNFSDFLVKQDPELINSIKSPDNHGSALTPSLTGLINFAFHGEKGGDVFDVESIKLNGEIPLSPLTLSNTASVDENLKDVKFSSPLSPKIRLLSNSHSPIELFSSPTPSILDNDSARSLLRTSDHEQILHLYSSYTCTIMSIKNGANENPWRNMIIPLASKYSCLFNSIACMTFFHLAGNNELSNTRSHLRAKGYSYMKKCIVDLATGLSRSDECESSQELPADIALATCLNLAVSESWDTSISSGIAHLKGAKSMIQKVLCLLREQQSSMINMNRELNNCPSERRSSIKEVIDTKKKELQKKLILLDNMEWERLLEGTEGSGSSDSASSNEKFQAIAIPKSLQFLFNIWIYFEVLAQMTTDTNSDDKGIDLVATITTMLQDSRDKENHMRRLRSVGSDQGSISDASSPGNRSESSESGSSTHSEKNPRPGFNIFENLASLNNNEYVDPLLGCAQSLFSLMGKVAALISKIRKNASEKSRNSLSIITSAAELKQQLIEWQPTITPSMLDQANSSEFSDDCSAGGTWNISSCITTAEAYRFATLLYLHQAVPEIPSLSSHQLAEKIFILLAAIPTSSHLYVVHIFPLLVGSCEAEPGEEREWCEARWAHLSQRMWIGNIDRAFEVVKEVWRRKDEYGRPKRRSFDLQELRFKTANSDKDDGTLRSISAQISGLMAVVNKNHNSSMEDILGGISSPLHWNTVMKEWGWEVLLG